ncbi:MAG: DUF4286 family protein [Acidobacteria bacterium]|nr:DUF4286 family protein [Acidobacteriota bacterium]
MKNEMLYEVTVTVDASIEEAFLSYMTGRHIPDVLATGCFIEAFFVTDEVGRYRTTYVAADRSDLNRYFSEFAEGLRDDFVGHFPSGVTVERQIWRSLILFRDSGGGPSN